MYKVGYGLRTDRRYMGGLVKVDSVMEFFLLDCNEIFLLNSCPMLLTEGF